MNLNNKSIYLTLNKKEAFEFKYTKPEWIIEKIERGLMDFKVSFLNLSENKGGHITESYLVIKSFTEDSHLFGLSDNIIFSIFKKNSSEIKEKLPTHVNYLIYSEFLSFLLEQSSIPSIESGEEEYLEMCGIEIRFETNDYRKKTLSELPFPAATGCDLLLNNIKKVYNHVY